MFESHTCHIEIFFDEFFVAGPGRCCQYSSFIVIQLSRPKETRASSESHRGCRTAVKNWSVMEEVVSLLLTNKLFNYVQRLWSYSLNSSGVGPESTPASAILSSISRYRSPAKLAARRMVQRPLTDHRQRLGCPPFKRLQRSDPKRFVPGGRFCAASWSP